MKTFLHILEQIGISWVNIVNGAIGGAVWSLYKKSKFGESLRQIFFGGIVSAYVTPLIGSKINLAYTGFLSFTIGMVGMVVVEIIYKWILRKIKLLFNIN